jgi:hypothetical protein
MNASEVATLVRGNRRTYHVHVVARHLTHRSAAGRATDETPRRRAQSPGLRAKPIVVPTAHSRTTSAGRSRVMSRTTTKRGEAPTISLLLP